jgi:hypothetical protein
MRRLSCYSGISGKLYALTTSTLDWPPLCVTGALEYFILFCMYVLSQRVHYCTLELMPLPRKSAEPKCNYNVVPYTSYYKENWPMATSPVRGEPSRTLQGSLPSQVCRCLSCIAGMFTAGRTELSQGEFLCTHRCETTSGLDNGPRPMRRGSCLCPVTVGRRSPLSSVSEFGVLHFVFR